MFSSRFDKEMLFSSLVLVSCIRCMPCSCGGPSSSDYDPVTSAWVVYWDAAAGIESIEKNGAVLDEINPFYYAFDDKGHIIQNNASTETAQPLLPILKSGRYQIIPTIVNDTISPGQANRLKDRGLIRFLLEDPERMEDHVDSIFRLVEAQSYDGIDIDYEKLHPSDRRLFTQFVEILAGRLHAADKLLTVTVQPITSRAQESKPGGLDWAAIGAAADRVRIMCYNYSYPGSAPGPIAPPDWIGKIIAYARKRIPAEKISLALKLQGFDWSESEARSVTFERAMAIAKEYEAEIEWDADGSTPHFMYYQNGKKHEVWFENARSLEAKLQAIDRRHVGGISLWRLGGEDPDIYPILTRYKKPSAAQIRSDTPD